MISDACGHAYLFRLAGELLIWPFLRPAAVVISRVSPPFASLGVVLLAMLRYFAAAFGLQLGRLHVSKCRCRLPPCSSHGPEHYRRLLDLSIFDFASVGIAYVQGIHRN